LNIDKLCFLGLFCSLILANPVWAQDTYQLGALPSVNFNYKLQKGWYTNVKMESRQAFTSGRFAHETDARYRYILTDFSVLLAKKVGLNARVAGGYLLRFREGHTVHRFIQHYSVVQRLNGYRLAHRIVFDQTFSAQQPGVFRLRYRLASEIPLNGESADPREFYFKLSNEYLNSLESQEYDLEIRLVPLLGYIFSPAHKIEIGLDYRVNTFLIGQGHHDFWTSVNWFIEM
jgi:hypothetical protein